MERLPNKGTVRVLSVSVEQSARDFKSGLLVK